MILMLLFDLHTLIVIGFINDLFRGHTSWDNTASIFHNEVNIENTIIEHDLHFDHDRTDIIKLSSGQFDLVGNGAVTAFHIDGLRTFCTAKDFLDLGCTRRQIGTISLGEDLIVVRYQLALIRRNFGNWIREFLMGHVHFLIVQIKILLLVELGKQEMEPMTFPISVLILHRDIPDTFHRSRGIFDLDVFDQIQRRIHLAEMSQNLSQMILSELIVIRLLKLRCPQTFQ